MSNQGVERLDVVSQEPLVQPRFVSSDGLAAEVALVDDVDALEQGDVLGQQVAEVDEPGSV